MAKKGEDRTFNVSVIGLSGTEREKGAVGVGKSCLCNRFISCVADKYYSDHISVLSQSDFAGRVINNDHFLYWGEVTKTDEGNNFTFHVIEQTEFIDDVSFQPFKTGRTDPYYKRCVATKVQSAEKLMYICKDQLGMETDSAYEQKLMPEGKLNIDGFICCFDASQVQQRTVEQQVDFITVLLNSAIKTKKPVVVVTTKTDEANERYLKEVERLVAQKGYKNNLPLIGTSSHDNVNVELAFMTLAHMIDKTKARPKIIQFADAVRQRKELLDVATEAYKSLLRVHVIDPKAAFAVSRKKLERESDFIHYVEHFGTESAKKLFRLHTKHLRDEQIRKRETHFMNKLPDVLQQFLPDLATIGDRSWPSCQNYIRHHEDFDHYFVEVCEEGGSWKLTPSFVDNYQESRLPFDLLLSCDAETCFRNHFNALQAQYRKLQLKKQFKKLLEDNTQVTPGKTLDETYLFFVGRDCYNDLKPHEREQVYEVHQHELRSAAKHEFQELLWEKMDIFVHMSNTPNTITQDDIRTITKDLEGDLRYHKLDKLEEERKVILFNHLGFMECPSRDRCYFRDGCAELMLQTLLGPKVFRSDPPHSLPDSSMRPLNLVLLGKNGLAKELCQEIRNMCNHDAFMYRNHVYSLDYRPIEEDVRLEYNSLATANFKPHGCLCVYYSAETLEYVRSSLESTLLADLQKEEDEHSLHGVPIIILHAYNMDLTEKEHLMLSDQGQQLAKKLNCEFKDIPSDEDLLEMSRFSSLQLEEALIRMVRGSGQCSTSRPCSEDLEPDLRIGMCLMCGDPYDVEIPLGPVLNSSPTQIECDQQSFSVTIETNVETSPEFSKQKIEICISSYHSFISKMFKDEDEYMFHGFILVFCTKRKASFFTMKAFAENLRNQMQVMPILVLAVTDSGGMVNTDQLTQDLLTEGKQTADFVGGDFKMTTPNFQQQTAVYMQFFKEAWFKRDEVSDSYYSIPSSPPAYAHTPFMSMDKRPPAPLPRTYDTYHTTKSSTSNSQSTEESEPLYDQVRHSDSELERPSSTSPPPSDAAPYTQFRNGDQLVKPSMIKKRQGANADPHKELYRKSYPASVLSTLSLERADNEQEPHYQVKKSHSMKLAVKDEEQAWAINEPRRQQQKKASTFPSDAKLIDNGRLDDDARRSSDETIWKDSDPLLGSMSQLKIGGKRTSKGSIQAPLALPEHIEISSDYATVKDLVNQCTSEGDYASVTDALPAGKLQRVKSQQRKKAATDSEDSEFSSLERDTNLYAKVNRKPTPHKKKQKSRSQDGRISYEPLHPDDKQKPHLRIRDRGTNERSNSPSEGSEGTGDELQLVKKEKKRRSLKNKKWRSPGGSESSGPGVLSPQLSDSDNLVGSPPSHYKEIFDREYATVPRGERFLGGYGLATSVDSADIDLNDSGNWKNKIKTLRKQKKQEEKKLKDDERRRQKEEERKQKEQQKQQKKNKKKDGRIVGSSESGCKLQEFPMSSSNPSLPQFVETCVEFIDAEGMHTEGIYRIPGNKQQVDLLQSKLQEDPCQDIRVLEIQVNAVATVLKNFFNDTEPLIPCHLHDELLEAAEKNPPIPDEEMPTGRLLALRGVLKKLHPVNFEVLKYFITHLNRVSTHKQTHSMDARNLALCLWPTIVRLDFNSYDKMAQGTKLPAEIVQTLIEQCGFFFHGEDEV